MARRKVWLGVCEPQNGNISKIRNLMAAAVPKGEDFAFTVPLVCRSVEHYWTKMFQVVKPAVIMLNDDAALFGSFEDWNTFMQCCVYLGNVSLDHLFVVNQHYEKQIYRDNDFEWYTPETLWEAEMRKQEKEAELRKQAEANIAARKAEEERIAKMDAKMLEELKCLKSTR